MTPRFLVACGCCGVDRILDRCEACGTLHPTERFVQRGVRLSTGTEHAIAFSTHCLASITAADWPRILANNLQCFEEAWEVKGVPEAVRARHREEMAGWRILGWADEVSAAQALDAP